MTKTITPMMAFPGETIMPSGGTMVSSGMTLRDWFAGQALAGLMADPNEAPNEDEDWERFLEMTTYTAYRLADAMVKAREGQSS